MIELLFFIIFALGFGYFSTQNTSAITIHVAQYTFSGIPIYIIIGGAFFLGLLCSWIISSIQSLFITLNLHKKENLIKNSKKIIHDLTKKVNQLEIENAKLQGKLEKDPLTEDSI